MNLNLTKPLIIFDIEATGLDLVRDRIIQLSYIRVQPDGTESRGSHLINPQKPIPQEVSALVGISDDDVKDCPTFKALAPQLAAVFAGCDLAGYNSNHFDVPLLAEEFLRAGVAVDIAAARLIDVQTIFHKMERRNLAAAYKFYCGREMADDFTAHHADDDAEATYRVLMGQLDRYSPQTEPDPERQLKNDMDFLAAFSRQNDFVDFAGRIVWADAKDAKGQPITGADGKPQRVETFNFGKHRGQPVAQVLRTDPGFISWMLANDFTYNTKQVLTRIRLKCSKANT